jgi:signal transduction histidine kinase/phage shock protein PspC (stress-responsive transcriptional regulator)
VEEQTPPLRTGDPGWYPPAGGWQPTQEAWPGRRRGWRRGPGRWHRPRGGGPLRRSQDDRLAGGVAAGLADRTGFDVTVIRIVIVVGTVLSGGFVAVLYMLAWLLLPAAGAESNIASKALADKRGIALAVGVASLLIVVVPIGTLLHLGWVTSYAWSVFIGLALLVLIWRNAADGELVAVRRLTEPLLGLTAAKRRRGLVLRVLIALVLLGSGIGTLQHAHESVKLLEPLAGVLLVISAIAVLFGPWWLRIARDLVVERAARIRAEERADMASRVHDSVLQTLALIQHRADQPQQVIQLARAQERELRSWLFDGRAPGTLDGETTFASGVRVIQQEVEAQHGIAVEAVTVGDCPLDDDLAALLAAAREATVNAAKWSGANVVSLFAEVEPAEVSLFVRDRGRGFDPAGVPGDRKGLAESVRARMARHGGSAAIRSTQGEGTEVSLTMPRAAREPSKR